ncbi:hypothetical protein ACTXT7_016513, partial [Hymenolepis weldensis]
TSTNSSYENDQGRVGTFRKDWRIATGYIFELGCPNCSDTKGEWIHTYLCRFPKVTSLTIEDDGKVFSKMQLSDAYLQVEAEPEIDNHQRLFLLP